VTSKESPSISFEKGEREKSLLTFLLQKGGTRSGIRSLAWNGSAIPIWSRFEIGGMRGFLPVLESVKRGLFVG
jgi:hypothetical protein